MPLSKRRDKSSRGLTYKGAMVQVHWYKNQISLYRLGTLPERRRKGDASRLLRIVFRYARRYKYEIHGWIGPYEIDFSKMRVDYDKTPPVSFADLAYWYWSLGFTVEPDGHIIWK